MVIAVVRFSDAELEIVTQLFVPLNDSALPNWPVTQVAFEIDPLLWLPEESSTVVPDPSLKPSSATRPVRLVAWNETETAVPGLANSMLPLSSAARVLIVTAPGVSGIQV